MKMAGASSMVRQQRWKRDVVVPLYLFYLEEEKSSSYMQRCADKNDFKCTKNCNNLRAPSVLGDTRIIDKWA